MSKKKSRKKVKKKKTLFRRFKKMSNLNKLAIISVLTVIFIAIVSGSTYAWFTANDSKDNQFNTDFIYKVDLIDKFTPPEKLEFGKTYSKTVAVENTGDIPAFARLLIFPEFKLENEILPINELVEVKYNISSTSNWILGEDGYYYYTKMIKPSEKSEILFDEVIVNGLSEKTKAMYANAEFSIDVKLESVDYRDNEYRISWWGNRDSAPIEKNLKLVDDKLQKEKR